ncbi:MAG: tRNA pseudouridine(54/55) synthase Pus10, partial [Promethearchaeota archaeon]
MSIFDKVIEIYKDQFLCTSCLGRMFSLLGTNTTNKDRGDSLLLSLTMDFHQKLLSGEEIDREQAKQNLIILSEKARYLPAKLVLEKEGIKSIWKSEDHDCYICHNIFENLEKYAKKAQEKVSEYEFTNFLVGSSPDATILNKEDKLKATNHIIEAESFKSHFNREMGKILSEKFEKEPEFHYPDLTIIYIINYESHSINLLIRSIFIYSRYKKLIRGIPQTRWPCGKCNGKGCEACDFTGKQYETSVEELICQEFVIASQAEGSKFHGAGREDIDVRMLGSGRPFILELINPKKRTLDLIQIKQKVNSKNKGKVEVENLRYSDKNEVIKIKEEAENT